MFFQVWFEHLLEVWSAAIGQEPLFNASESFGGAA
jgi:hypothetical protein